MPDVRELLAATTPEAADLPEIDYDALARRGTRRRVGKRIGATALVLAVLGGSVVLLGEAFADPDELEIVEQPDAVPPIDDRPDPDPQVADEPDPGEWEALPSGPLDARQDPFVAALDDGRIVVAGGSVPHSSRSRTDAAVLSADRTSWTRLPEAPLTGRLVQFTLRGATLWARNAPSRGDPAFAEHTARLARLDLDAPDAGWDELPDPPVDGVLDPVVTVFDDTVVVFGPTIETGTGDSEDLSVTRGVVWRDGAWTPFDAAPRPVTAAFIGVDEDHVAVVGGQTDGEVIADTAILDLATVTWRSADPMPAGPRIHTDPAASAIVVDGRMFVAGGYADPIRPAPPDQPGPTHADPTPCPPPAEDGCMIVHSQPGRLDGTSGDEADNGDVSITWSTWPREPATGAAWLDLATGEWEEVQLPVGEAVVPHAVRSDPLTAPAILELTPRHPVDGTYWRLTAAGEIIQFDLPELPYLDDPFLDPGFPDLRFTRIDLDDDGDPALAVRTRIDRLWSPDRPVAVPAPGGGFVEATIPEPLAGVTYVLIDGHLHAFGGVPYQADRDENGRIASEISYDFEQPLLARVLQR